MSPDPFESHLAPLLEAAHDHYRRGFGYGKRSGGAAPGPVCVDRSLHNLFLGFSS